MNLLDAIILGLVEGITEYLPVSSTGHLILTASLLGLYDDESAKGAVDTFTIVIQGGAILAVLGLYWPRIVQMLKGLSGRDAVGRRLLTNLVIAFLPAAVFGVLLNELIESYLFYPGPVIAALAVGGVIMIGLGPWQRKFFHETSDAEPEDVHTFVDMEHLTWRRALIIGFLQCVAMWPGTSRSMMTIVGGMLVGMRPKQAAEFSFLLGLPTLGGACVYKIVKDILSEEPSLFLTLGAIPVIVGILVATIAAALAVKWLVGFLSRHGVAAFGWYRIALAVVLGGLVWRGLITFPTSDTDQSRAGESTSADMRSE